MPLGPKTSAGSGWKRVAACCAASSAERNVPSASLPSKSQYDSPNRRMTTRTVTANGIGRRRRWSTKTAKLLYRDKIGKIARGEVLGVREEGIKSVGFVERKYWPTIRPPLSLWEQRRARSILDTQILPRFGALKLVRLRREEIEGWQAERLAAVSGSTVNKEVKRLKHLLNRAVAWGYLKDTPAKAVGRVKEAPGRSRYLSAEEREWLMNGADSTVQARDGRTWTTRRGSNPALRLYILTALHTGARRGELLGLRWSDVDVRAQMLTFHRTKNGDARTVPLTDTRSPARFTRTRMCSLNVTSKCSRGPSPVWSGGLASRIFASMTFDSTLTIAGVPQRTVMALPTPHARASQGRHENSRRGADWHHYGTGSK